MYFAPLSFFFSCLDKPAGQQALFKFLRRLTRLNCTTVGSGIWHVAMRRRVVSFQSLAKQIGNTNKAASRLAGAGGPQPDWQGSLTARFASPVSYLASRVGSSDPLLLEIYLSVHRSSRVKNFLCMSKSNCTRIRCFEQSAKPSLKASSEKLYMKRKVPWNRPWRPRDTGDKRDLFSGPKIASIIQAIQSFSSTSAGYPWHPKFLH